MAKLFPSDYAGDRGELKFELTANGNTSVYYYPSIEKISIASILVEDGNFPKELVMSINAKKDELTFFPIITFAHSDNFLESKYKDLERITLEGLGLVNDFGPTKVDDYEIESILYGLPDGLIKDFEFGFGFLKDCRFIMQAVNSLYPSCPEIIISKTRDTRIDRTAKSFVISYSDYTEMVRLLGTITGRSRAATVSVKEAAIGNVLRRQLGEDELPIRAHRVKMTQLFVAAANGEEVLDDEQQNVIMDAISENKEAIAKENPEKLMKLQNDIELVNLERLISIYENMLTKNLNEGEWQKFFNDNPFILNLAFGYPIIKIQNQASVGGRKISGSGEKITDFLLKNSLTNNVAIFEIKTPKTALLNKTEYRSEVYTPASDLSGSINQTLDQKYQLLRQFATLKDTSRIHDIEAYAIHCCLIIGQTPDGEDRKKSLELFRRNSKDVSIITFDELLEKLKQLHNFLSTNEEAA